MLGELVNITTDTLIDRLFLILADGVVLTSRDVAELEQIERELQRRIDNGSTAHSQFIREIRNRIGSCILQKLTSSLV